MVPFLGGASGAVAFILSGNSLSPYWWVPLVADYGSLPVVTVWIYNIVRHRSR